jgi:dUTPase
MAIFLPPVLSLSPFPPRSPKFIEHYLTHAFTTFIRSLGVVLFNHGEVDFEVKRGDRIAQLILERICMADIVEVEELSSTERGAGGFGSTGVSS